MLSVHRVVFSTVLRTSTREHCRLRGAPNRITKIFWWMASGQSVSTRVRTGHLLHLHDTTHATQSNNKKTNTLFKKIDP